MNYKLHKKKIALLRRFIDNYDQALITILSERFRCTRQIGLLKAKYGMKAFDGDRYRYQTEKTHKNAQELGLDPVLAQKMLDLIHKTVLEQHEQIKEEIAKSAKDTPPKSKGDI